MANSAFLSPMFWWLSLLLLLAGLFMSSWFKHAIAEMMVRFSIRLFLNTRDYHLIKTSEIPGFENRDQIDHIIVSRFGIFLICIKKMKGWILGYDWQTQWTQLNYQNMQRFTNPLHQANQYSDSLASRLGIDASKVFPMIVFVGDCNFKSPMPKNVMYGADYLQFIKTKKEPLLSETDIQKSIQHIKNGCTAIPTKHPRHADYVRATLERNHVPPIVHS